MQFRKQMNFLFQNTPTFYCLNEEKRMTTSQKLAVKVKLFTGKIEHAGHIKYRAQSLKSQSFIHSFEAFEVFEDLKDRAKYCPLP